MPLLLDTDYAELESRGIACLEDEVKRFLVLKEFQLPEGLYDHPQCDVLIVIPPNYNHAGNDMLWTYPRLHRSGGGSIPATGEPGQDSREYDGRVFCRWSRHWHGRASAWKAGESNITTILNRITWAFDHPDCK